MKDHAGESVSVWMATTCLPKIPSLQVSEHADVCIIGAGIAGLLTAYRLSHSGRSVILLDDGPIASGETERTTAHLTAVLDSRYFELENLHGEGGSRLAAASHIAAINEIEEMVRREQIECGFERLDGYLFSPPQAGREDLDRELAAALRAGISSVELVPSTSLGAFEIGPALRFPGQAQFHPLQFLGAVTSLLLKRGVRIYTEAHALRIVGGSPARIELRDGPTVTADAVVVATNTPVNDVLAMHTKQASYRTFAIGALVPSGTIKKGLYWDTLDPYHYVRLQPLPAEISAGVPSDCLIVGGEDHKTGQADNTEERYALLESWARTYFPMMADVRYRWSGQVVEPVDGLAYIGQNPMDDKNVYIATGFSGNGMTYGMISGILLADLIQGHSNPWQALYDPTRKTLRAAKTFAKETLNMAAQYGAWFTHGDIPEEAVIAEGTGAVIRRGLHKVAVYCDHDGQIHECSAVCPHLGGIVAWNHSEETWDCPCHGSRFDKFGKVLNGPAITDLQRLDRLRPEVVLAHQP